MCKIRSFNFRYLFYYFFDKTRPPNVHLMTPVEPKASVSVESNISNSPSSVSLH